MINLARLPRPGAALALLTDSRWLRLLPNLVIAAGTLVASGCSSDQPTEPGEAKPAGQLSEAVAGGFIRDDFTDANGTLLTSHVPDGGGDPFSWLPTVWLEGEEEAVIQDNAVSATRSGNWVYVTSVETGDRVELAFEVFREITDGQDVGFILRTEAGGFQDGLFVFWGISPTSNFVELSSPRVVAQLPAPLSQGLHTLRAEIVGSRLDVYADGARIISEAVPVPSARRTAIGLFRSAAPDVRLTSFSAGLKPAVRIEAVNGSLEVWPSGLSGSGASGENELQLRVRVDGGGMDLKDQWVKLSLAAIDSSATALDSAYGHHHKGAGGVDKPTGKLSVAGTELANGDSVNTGSGLDGLVKYRSSLVSGPVMVMGETEGATSDTVAIRVGVPGLVELVPGPTFDTIIGARPETVHWPNNWVTPGMRSLALRLAQDFHAKHPKKLGFNDASLNFGGKFDLRSQWTDNDPGCKFRDRNRNLITLPNGCHQRHRVGLDLDLRIRDLTTIQKNDIRVMWPELTKRPAVKTTVGVEGDHFHLAYRP